MKTKSPSIQDSIFRDHRKRQHTKPHTSCYRAFAGMLRTIFREQRSYICGNPVCIIQRDPSSLGHPAFSCALISSNLEKAEAWCDTPASVFSRIKKNIMRAVRARLDNRTPAKFGSNRI